MQKILFGTNNPHKVLEAKEIIRDLPIEIVTPLEVGLVNFEPEESGNSYQANAHLKADDFAMHTNLPTLAEDSGVETLVFLGFPGIHSARWHEGNDQDRVLALLDKMKDINNRGFVYHTVVVYLDPVNKIEKSFAGTLRGQMAFEARGATGFGYDPIMIPEGYTQTLAELGQEEKNRISHRRQAFCKFVNWYRQKEGLSL